MLLYIASGWVSSKLEVAWLEETPALLLEERESEGWWQQELGLA